MSATLFRLPPRGTSDVLEVPAWLTSLLTSHDGHEQRSELRAAPAIGLQFDFTAEHAVDLQALEAMMLASTAGAWRMPVWPHRRRLTLAALAGATAVYADLAWLPRTAQDGIHRFLLWTRSGSVEQLEASAVTDTHLELSAPLAGTWPAGSILVPVLEGRLDSPPDIQRLHRSAYVGRISFSANPVDAVSYLAPEPGDVPARLVDGYLGCDVLTGLRTGLRQWDGEAFARQAILVGSEAGRRSWMTQEPMAAMARTIHPACHSAREAAALRAFLDARRGRAVPFWLPSWNQDLTILSADGDSLEVYDPAGAGYADLLFPLGPQRRHLQLWADGQEPVYRSVLAAARQSSTVVALQLDSALPAEVDGSWLVSFLRYCRLDTDAPQLAWRGERVACDLPVREIPAECPAWRAEPEVPETLAYQALGGWAIASEGDLAVETPEEITVPGGCTLVVAIGHDEAAASEIDVVSLGSVLLERVEGSAQHAFGMAEYRLYCPVERSGRIQIYWRAVGGGIPDNPPLTAVVLASCSPGLASAAALAAVVASGHGASASSGATGALTTEHALALAHVLVGGQLADNPANWAGIWTAGQRVASDGLVSELAIAEAWSIRTDPTSIAAAKAVAESDWTAACMVLGAA